VLHLVVNAIVDSSSLSIFTLIMEVILSSERSVLTRVTRRYNPEDGILQTVLMFSNEKPICRHRLVSGYINKRKICGMKWSAVFLTYDKGHVKNDAFNNFSIVECVLFPATIIEPLSSSAHIENQTVKCFVWMCSVAMTKLHKDWFGLWENDKGDTQRAFSFCNPILFAISISTYGKLCKHIYNIM
jgi:hypothetical protein